eukprot:6957939-Alexandrium_andersonii.AAC.1
MVMLVSAPCGVLCHIAVGASVKSIKCAILVQAASYCSVLSYMRRGGDHGHSHPSAVFVLRLLCCCVVVALCVK